MRIVLAHNSKKGCGIHDPDDGRRASARPNAEGRRSLLEAHGLASRAPVPPWDDHTRARGRAPLCALCASSPGAYGPLSVTGACSGPSSERPPNQGSAMPRSHPEPAAMPGLRPARVSMRARHGTVGHRSPAGCTLSGDGVGSTHASVTVAPTGRTGTSSRGESAPALGRECACPWPGAPARCTGFSPLAGRHRCSLARGAISAAGGPESRPGRGRREAARNGVGGPSPAA